MSKMRKSVEKSTSEKSSALPDNVYNYKSIFINNLDSYHGAYILKNMTEILKKNVEESKESMASMFGEDVGYKTPPPAEPSYEIMGTVFNPKIKSLDGVSKIVSKSNCLSQMLACGTVILDISSDNDELDMVSDYVKLLKDLLVKTKDQNAPTSAGDTDDVEPVDLKKRHLILISSVMTWAGTKPLDPDNPDMPFIETDFRKRKAHPNYKRHIHIENEVIGIARQFRSQIGAIVVAAGVTYGGKEDTFHHWFQKAWECDKFLPILGRGSNMIPIINVVDLAQIVYNLTVDFPKKLYILAVGPTPTRQREIIKSLGHAVGSGMFKCIPPEDGYFIKRIDQRVLDLMNMNLSMEPTFIVETMNIEWTSELSFGENVTNLMKEFTKERNLKSFKVVIHGPPIVGKTTLAKKLCDQYGLMYISPETILKDLEEDLTWRIAHWETGEKSDLPMTVGEEAEIIVDDDEENPEDVEALLEEARNTLAFITSGRPLTDDELLPYIRQQLLCREALNKGWVLDGYPTNSIQCATLFDKGEDDDDEAEDVMEGEQFDEDIDLYSNVLKKILPDIVVTLEATDEYICDKAMRQPETENRLDEEKIMKRLSEFRAANTRDATVLNFFDELDIHPLVVAVKDPTDYEMQCPFEEVSLRMGRPCVYDTLTTRLEEFNKKEKAKRDAKIFNENKAAQELEKMLKEEREDQMEYWSELYSLMREEEEAALAVAGEPMRNYLVNHIFPTLTPALLEVAKVRPVDPIDYLAEHLFKMNPSGKMLEPGYNLQGEKLMGKIKILDEAIQNLEINIDPLLPPEAEISSPTLHKQNLMSNL